MAIYAQHTAFRSTAQFPDFKVTSPINSGDFLLFDPVQRAFINKSASSIASIIGASTTGGTGTGSINSASNIGTGAELFKQLTIDDLEFRTLLAGQGITITQGADEISISNDIITLACISVNDSFKVVIDDDNTTVNSAKFEIFTNDNAVNFTVSPVVTFISPNFDITVVTDITFTNPGQFISATADFTALGFVAGMCLRATGTGEQDGVWKIASIDTTTNTNDTITITVAFPDPIDAGLQPPTTLEAMFLEFTGVQTIVLFGRDLIVDGFVSGQTFNITGSTDNDGTYTVNTVSGDTLTIVETFPGTIGCDVGNINFLVPADIISTGFWVNEKGELYANATTICGNLEVICDGTFHVEGDTIFDGNVDIALDLTVGGLLIEDLIASVLPIFPTNGIMVQTSIGVFDARIITVNPGLTITNADGIAGNPNIDINDFDITLTGDITGTATVTDLGNTILSTTLSNNGVIAGNFNRVTVDSTGRVTLGENQAILGSAGILIANGDGIVGNPTITAADFIITLSGDVTGFNTVTELGDVTIAVNIAASGVIPGTYNKVTVGTDGRITSGINQSITAGSGIIISNGDGVAADPIITADNFDLTFTGNVTGTGTVTGLTNTIIGLSLENVGTPGTYNQITTDAQGRVISGTTVALTFQPLDTDLTDLANGMDFPGYVVWTGAAYEDRSIAGAVNEIIITDAIAATQTVIGLADFGTPGTYNQVTVDVKGRITSGITVPLDFLPLAGGTMTGNIDMTGADILNTGTVDGRDISADGIILDAINTGIGLKVQTAPDTFVNRTIISDATTGVVVANGDGVSNNPTISYDLIQVPTLEVGQVIDPENDYLLMHDATTGQLRKVEPERLTRNAFRYFYAQI